jgi:hypothetical protein
MERFVVLVVELDGLEGVVERLTHLPATQPEIARDVILAQALLDWVGGRPPAGPGTGIQKQREQQGSPQNPMIYRQILQWVLG